MIAFYELTYKIKVGGDDFALPHCIQYAALVDI